MPLVYSTNPDFNLSSEEESRVETLPPSKQKLTVYLDRRNRGGKSVTLVKGFAGNEEDLAELGRRLKSRCGTGGSVKDGEILIQGDCRDKVTAVLTQMGYVAKRGN
ncbi:MAG TPA: translation initiation factor [Candidatus Coprenecus pullistercoris]|nr:translation initiation factor [Candidatus Coprenecus pullistercoris]